MAFVRVLTLLVVLLGWLGLPSDSRACCVAPHAEPPVLVTPTGAAVPAGGALLAYLSSDAVRWRFTLVAGAVRLPVTPRALSTGVYALDVPATAAPGSYALETQRPSPASAPPYTPGTVTVVSASAARALPTPSGRITLRTSPGRWAPSRAAVLALAPAAPADVAVVFRWRDAQGEHGNAAWVTPGTEPSMVADGHCGTYPFGATVPPAGTAVDVAFVDARGALGPWAHLRVE